MIKNVLVKLEFDGRGIVNNDSNDQKWVLKGTHLKAYHDNVTFSKKCFYKNNDPDVSNDVDYKIKISENCLLKNAKRYIELAQVPSIIHNPALLYSAIASPEALVCGYLFPSTTGSITRSGALNLTSAIQTCNAKSVLEVFSRSGQKKSNDGTEDGGDTTFYFKETVGDIKYSATANIDVMGLQFIPCDIVFDRYQINPDYFQLYKQFLQKKLPNFNSELGYYQLKDSSIEIPEYGVLLSNENIVYLTKFALKLLLGINIAKKGGYARTSSLKIKLVTDPLDHIYNDENDWITVQTSKDIEALDFNAHKFYKEIDLELAKKFRMEFTEKIAECKRIASEAKKEKKAKKKKSKEDSDE